MSNWAAKRFWDSASVQPKGAGFGVALDDRALQTPAKQPLIVPTKALAQAVADEWDRQTDVIDPAQMPFTRSANAAIDKVSAGFEPVAAMIADYGDADLICYRASDPEGLVARQALAWDPLIDWAAVHLNARLKAQAGVIHAPQEPKALAALGQAVRGKDAYELTALHDLVTLSGSLVMGLAGLDRAFEIDDLWARSRVDEDWQISVWGEDDEATKHAESRRASFFHAFEFADLAAN